MHGDILIAILVINNELNNIIILFLPSKSLGAVFLFYFKKCIFTFIFKRFISQKCCSFKRSIHQLIKKKVFVSSFQD